MLTERAKDIRRKLAELFPLLNERQRRLLAAAEARDYGRGGVSIISEITGLSRQTIYNGLRDLESLDKTERVRSKGGGRKRSTDCMPELLDALEEIVGESTRGDPESPLRWTCKSVRRISTTLRDQGFEVSHQTVARILHDLDYSLQANRKTSEGVESHPDRDSQFQFINALAKKFIKRKYPVISVDTKKKELIGEYKNPGKEWRYKGNPIEVLTHDFPDPKVPKAVPYGVYDIAHNEGWVNVGISADTAEFAVESIRQWWKRMGVAKYKRPRKLLITADSGGSNGYRIHLWKYELQRLVDELQVPISVCHFPPGKSKWNKIEHRLFSFISINWRGKPLRDYRTIVDLIGSTTTKSGLTVKARLDKRKYTKGRKVTASEIKSLNISRSNFHGEWNYTINPRNV